MADNQSADLQAFVRGTRRVLLVQLVAALVLVGVTVVVAWQLPTALASLSTARTALATAQEDMRDAQRLTGLMIEARPDVRAGVDSLEQGDAAGALSFLERARTTTESRDAEVLRYLARAQFLNGQHAEALATLQAALELLPDAQETPIDQGWLATLHCANNDAPAARAILTSAEFVSLAADQTFLGNFPGLQQACGETLAAELAALQPQQQQQTNAPVTEAGAAEDAYRIQTIFIQYTRREDRAKAEALRRRLDDDPRYVAPGIELIDGARANVIRYYYDPQRAQAEQIRNEIRAMLDELQWGGDYANMRISSLGGRFPNLRRDRIELWLPPGDDTADASRPRPAPSSSSLP